MLEAMRNETMPVFAVSVASALLAAGAVDHTAARSSPIEKPTWQSAPPQHQGLPYTRSSRSRALEKIRGSIAVFPGSRYAYVKGYKVRLDDTRWREEAVVQDGRVFVPERFAAVLSLKEIRPSPAPPYLADRWVYSLPASAVRLPAGVGRRDIGGSPYVDLAAAARATGWKARRGPHGILMIGTGADTLNGMPSAAVDSIITLFDTPEKFADPDIATKYIPTLARQGKWTDHIRATPEQMKLLNGPETKWPTVPRSDYDLTGFNARLLGSRVPPPGVYPRVLFSPEDVPMLAARVNSSKAGQMALIEMEYLFKKSWWNPATSDGQIFRKLSEGQLSGLEWPGIPPGSAMNSIPQQFKGEQPGIHNSHVAYVPECLTSMALFCLLTGDEEHGRQAAAAIANYFKLREPLIDELNAVSDSEFGSSFTRADGTVANTAGDGAETHYRAIHGLAAHMNLGLSLDFAGKWMSAEQKELMRRVIAKCTYGRRPYGQDAPVRFRDVNWVTWDLPHLLALAAIEGLEGFDPEGYDSDRETVRAFCDWGIDEDGVIYESNGKTPGGLQFQLLSMVALARRGENLWGHPHWRKLLDGQLHMTSPTGRVVVNSGTQYVPFSRQVLSYQFVDERKAFYPGDRRADYLLSQARQFQSLDPEGTREWMLADFSPETYKSKVSHVPRLRLPSVTYPGFVHGVLYDTDFEPTSRADLDPPLDFSAPVHGIFSSYSDSSPAAAWICLMVRPDHYLGAGHHHADAGMFHFSALGVDWITESPFSQAYDGKYHNQVLVDGISEAQPSEEIANGYQAAAKYIAARMGKAGAWATADLTNSYSYRWLTQPPQIWKNKMQSAGWEMDPSPEIQRIFAGTARYKMRPWWLTHNYSNYIPTSRAPFNPMRYVYRTTALVRGRHPYGLVIDDVKKDDKRRLYQWTAMLNGGVWQANVPGIGKHRVVLGYRESDPKAVGQKTLIQPTEGQPLLMVCAVGLANSGDATLPLMQVSNEAGPADRNGKPQTYDRIAVNQTATGASYKIVLIPFRFGEPLPDVTWDAKPEVVLVRWGDQSDEIRFTSNADHRTELTVRRNGQAILASR